MDPGMATYVEQARALLETATAPGPERDAALAELEQAWPAIIQICSVDPASRLALADLQPAVAELEEEHEWAHWIALMLAVLHEAPFVAIEPSSGKAVGGRISGVSENFQLHTLLMDAFDRPVDPEVLAIARGDGPQQGDREVAGAWNLYTYRALRDGRLPEPDASQSGEWIWNEGVPAVIPEIDGTRVILLGEPLYERTWDAVRTFPALRATLDPSALSQQDARAWLDPSPPRVRRLGGRRGSAGGPRPRRNAVALARAQREPSLRSGARNAVALARAQQEPSLPRCAAGRDRAAPPPSRRDAAAKPLS